MTDDRMDALLHEVGGRWRDNHPGGSDVPMPAAEPRRVRPRWPLLVSAAAVAAALIAGLVVTIAGLGGDTAPVPAAGLAGTVWRLTVNGRPAPSGATLYIAADGTMVADDECAVVGATLDSDRGQLVPTDFEIRPRNCLDQTGQGLGSAFVQQLTEFPRYKVTGNRLTIGSGRAQRDFVADPALPRPTLDVPSVLEARWRLTGVRSAAGGELAVPKDVEFRIADTRLTTSDGCNDTSADAAVNGDRLDLKGLTSTARGCPPAALATTVIDAVFGGTVVQRVTADRLMLSRAGAGVLTYEWVPDDASATDPARLVGPDFRLVSVAGQPADGPYSISFREGRNYGADDCNGTSDGAAVLEHGAFRLTSGLSTLIRCPKALSSGQLDTVVTTLYRGTALWTVRDGKLTVRGDGAQSSALVFAVASAVPAQTAPTLLGTWTLTAVMTDNGNSGGGTSGPDLGVTVTFAADRYRTTGLCGSPRGTYAVSGDELQVRTGGQDFCLSPGSGRHVEELFIEGTMRWAVAGTELTLVRGAVTLTFTKK